MQDKFLERKRFGCCRRLLGQIPRICINPGIISQVTAIKTPSTFHHIFQHWEHNVTIGIQTGSSPGLTWVGSASHSYACKRRALVAPAKGPEMASQLPPTASKAVILEPGPKSTHSFSPAPVSDFTGERGTSGCVGSRPIFRHSEGGSPVATRCPLHAGVAPAVDGSKIAFQVAHGRDDNP